VCPTGYDSWCGYERAKASVINYYYKHSLPQPLPEAIDHIYKEDSFSSNNAARA
jgi:hypothetical protein